MTQIIRARHQRHFHWLGNLHRNHILKHRIPQSHAHIKALFNNIHPAIFDHQFHINLWIFLQKRTQSRIQNPVRHQLAGVNPNRPLRLITQRIQLPNTVLNRLKVRAISASNFSPTSVSDTLRVVRLNRRIFNRVSRLLILWLNADAEISKFCAAFTKLPNLASVTK